LIVAQDNVWAGLQLAIALILLLGGYWLIRLGPETIACALVASFTSAMSVLGLLALAAADALNEQGRIFRLDWNLGLVLPFPGHGIMITAACVALIFQLSTLHRPTQP
jgi:NADH:ubiquinone oxidoreductase subunit 6 (subunit J)